MPNLPHQTHIIALYPREFDLEGMLITGKYWFKAKIVENGGFVSKCEYVKSKISVRFIDGVSLLMPVDACKISDDQFQIIADPEYDYMDNSILFEFGPDDSWSSTPKSKNPRFDSDSY